MLETWQVSTAKNGMKKSSMPARGLPVDCSKTSYLERRDNARSCAVVGEQLHAAGRSAANHAAALKLMLPLLATPLLARRLAMLLALLILSALLALVLRSMLAAPSGCCTVYATPGCRTAYAVLRAAALAMLFCWLCCRKLQMELLPKGINRGGCCQPFPYLLAMLFLANAPAGHVRQCCHAGSAAPRGAAGGQLRRTRGQHGQ